MSLVAYQVYSGLSVWIFMLSFQKNQVIPTSPLTQFKP